MKKFNDYVNEAFHEGSGKITFDSINGSLNASVFLTESPLEYKPGLRLSIVSNSYSTYRFNKRGLKNLFTVDVDREFPEDFNSGDEFDDWKEQIQRDQYNINVELREELTKLANKFDAQLEGLLSKYGLKKA